MQRTNKSAMALAWNFFKGNYALNFAVVAILIVLNILGMLPIIGMLFIFGYSILELSVQIFFGRRVTEVQSEEDMQHVAAQTKIGEFLSTYLAQAAGAFLALFLLTLLFGALFGVIFSFSGGMQMMNGAMEAQVEQMVFMMGVPSLLLMLIIAVMFYFFPAVMGKVIKSEDFVSAFKSIFLLFSPSLWKSTFNKDYFVLILIWSLIVTVAVVVIMLMMGTIILIPVGLILAYLLSLYNAAIYVFAEELAK
jgi:hypothetical protein